MNGHDLSPARTALQGLAKRGNIVRFPSISRLTPLVAAGDSGFLIIIRGHFRITEMAPDVGEFEGSIPSIVK